MAILQWKFAPHLLWLAAVVAFFFLTYAAKGDVRYAVEYVNGIMVNLFDPIVWFLALLPAVKIRHNLVLVLVLFTVAALLTIFKLYMRHITGYGWITGSVLGNVVGFITVGYVINAISVFRRSRKSQPTESGA